MKKVKCLMLFLAMFMISTIAYGQIGKIEEPKPTTPTTVYIDVDKLHPGPISQRSDLVHIAVLWVKYDGASVQIEKWAQSSVAAQGIVFDCPYDQLDVEETAVKFERYINGVPVMDAILFYVGFRSISSCPTDPGWAYSIR